MIGDDRPDGAMETSYERQVREAKAALDAMPDPDPASSRQVIIALKQEIREKKRGRGLEAVWKAFVALGHDITFGTFRDYIYSGKRSRAAHVASEAERDKRRKRSRRSGEPTPAPAEIVVPLDATESTASGKPVRARPMR